MTGNAPGRAEDFRRGPKSRHFGEHLVLIGTYDRLGREGVAAYEAIIETRRGRARPVVLTAVTAILGVLPIAFGMNIEFMTREITIGAPGGSIFPPRSCSGWVSRPCSRWW